MKNLVQLTGHTVTGIKRNKNLSCVNHFARHCKRPFMPKVCLIQGDKFWGYWGTRLELDRDTCIEGLPSFPKSILGWGALGHVRIGYILSHMAWDTEWFNPEFWHTTMSIERYPAPALFGKDDFLSETVVFVIVSVILVNTQFPTLIYKASGCACSQSIKFGITSNNISFHEM